MNQGAPAFSGLSSPPRVGSTETRNSLTTSEMPGAAHPAPAAAERSDHECTVPCSVAREPLTDTSMCLASSSACRVKASLIRLVMLDGAA